MKSSKNVLRFATKGKLIESEIEIYLQADVLHEISVLFENEDEMSQLEKILSSTNIVKI